MKKDIGFFVLIVILMVLFGCKQGQKTEQQECTEEDTEVEVVSREGICLLPGDYEVDYPKDLVAYFDSLCQKGAYVATHTDEEEDSLAVWDAIRLLDRFAQGKSRFYPATQIRSALEILRLEQAYCFNHSGQEGNNGGEAFMFRLIEQAALHCDQIDYITNFRADDRKVGVLYFGEWGLGLPLYSILVYQTHKGFHVKMIGGVGGAKIEKIFHLKDNEGHDYYLCSNNDDGVYFCQYLYSWKNDDLCLISEMDVEFGCPESNEKGYELVFNPTQCTWSYCKKDGDIYHPVSGTPILHLILDGDSSKFVVE